MQQNRPAITAAQILGLLVAGVPIVAQLLHVFGVYDLSPEQQDALSKALEWAVPTAIALFGADAGLRAARNHAVAKTAAPSVQFGSVGSPRSEQTGSSTANVTWTTPPVAEFTPARSKQVWYPKAHRSVIRGQEGGTQLTGRPKIVLHTTEGSSIAGAEAAYRASGGSAPHFTISRTSVHQHIPINRSAYSLEHPSGTPETNRAGAVIQIEQVGFAKDTGDWPDSYYQRVAELVAWIHANAGVPRQQVSNGIHADFTNPKRIPADEWANWSGVCGHVHVPNNHHTDPGTGYHVGLLLP